MKTTEEERIKGLLSDFEPDMKSDRLFMSRLESRLFDVDVVKSRIEKTQRLNRFAMYVAGLAGFLFGVVVALCYPYIVNFIASVAAAMSELRPGLNDYAAALTWGVVGAVGMILIFSAYDITLLALRRTGKY